ncbi:MAG TPA: UvrD-helicase domain-containing protein [Thermoleophilaceae bacterium]|nr:UvrD-helicase domain-containing protein [Thermoleophilaceae bacterium]
MRELTPEQRRAVDRRDGSLLVRAGAGTGKTTVLVERFVQAVTEGGAEVDQVLAITFTEKAAAEMKSRVRRRFLELGRREDARAAESAWVSTIDGLCSRILRAHALSAGVDPAFRVLDELESERIAADAFDGALEEFMGVGAAPGPDRVEMVAAYTPDRLRDMVRTAYSHLRSRGERHPRLGETLPPRPAGEAERLAAAARAALAELAAAGGGVTVDRAIASIEARAEIKGKATALGTETCAEYRDALAAYRALEVAKREHRDHTMLRVLLELYGQRYDAAKRERSGLDFEDLELVARDLLRRDEGLRESYSSRFEHVLVDEFQDTNRLQNELLALLSRNPRSPALPGQGAGNLFRVGDENQSIYRFRNADVSVFREHWEEARESGRTESITVNFRARGEILDAIDLAFERAWGEHFEPLREAPGSREPAAPMEPCVDLLVVDRARDAWKELNDGGDFFGEALHGAPPWRAAEARLLAKRVDELTRGGPWSYGDVVILFRATTAMGLFERALDERGIPVHVVGGRGYWGQQQVADLRHWLAALANPLDGLALFSVLASPLAGLSLDAVALIGLHARRSGRDPWRMVREPSDELAAALPDADRRKLSRFAERFAAERRIAGQVSLETLIDRAVTLTGYDRHLLALPGGTRRMANVRKLMRTAREYEADEGRDLRGFIDAVAERDVIHAREGEAPLEAEALDAVRMMTVHRAKGLEFPVVCVADLGKDGREDDGQLRISDDGSVGLRLANLGGGAVDSTKLAQIKAEGKRAAEQEERRIVYVAVTRAQEHLVLSGATDLVKRPDAAELAEPMRWIWRGFCAGLPSEGASGVEVDSREGREAVVRWEICTPATVDEVLPAADRAPAPPEVEEQPAYEQPMLELGLPPAPRALAVSRLSFSGLEEYRRCGYRFFLERTLKLAKVDKPPGEEPAESGLGARRRGSVVHALLERLDFGNPVAPSDADVATAIALHEGEALPADVEDIRAMLERVANSELRERIAGARRVRTELPFAFTLTPPGAGGRSILINGVVDVLADAGARTLIVDWKSNPLGELDPEDIVQADYATQRLIYALAALRAGAEVVEVAHCFLERPDEPALALYEAADMERLERELLGLAQGVVEGRFEPSSEPHYALCADCPGRAALCVHEPELTLRAVRQAGGSAPGAGSGFSVGTPS